MCSSLTFWLKTQKSKDGAKLISQMLINLKLFTLLNTNLIKKRRPESQKRKLRPMLLQLLKEKDEVNFWINILNQNK